MKRPLSEFKAACALAGFKCVASKRFNVLIVDYGAGRWAEARDLVEVYGMKTSFDEPCGMFILVSDWQYHLEDDR